MIGYGQLCMEAALQCIRERMDDIDVDADEIDAKVSYSRATKGPSIYLFHVHGSYHTGYMYVCWCFPPYDDRCWTPL